jgi:t-SNARE complex subunit (syntaxin)
MTVFDEGFIQIQQNKQIADELEVRKNEMLNLEHAIRELHALFVEMASLVEEQGEMVNRILDNVNNTEAYVEKAVEDVHQAARYQSSARRKKIWIVILCLSLLRVYNYCECHLLGQLKNTIKAKTAITLKHKITIQIFFLLALL